MNSKRYDNGALWTSCADCNRGGNGTAKNKCSAGGHIKEWNKLGCFSGVLLPQQIGQLQRPLLKWAGTQDETARQWHQANDVIVDNITD